MRYAGTVRWVKPNGGRLKNASIRIVVLLLAVLIALWLESVMAAPVGSLDVVLIDQTLGAAPPSGTEVVLHSRANNVQLADRASRSDAAGVAHFADLDVSPTTQYVASVDFDEVTYESNVMAFVTPEVSLRVPLTLWQSTRDDPGLTVKTAALVLSTPDAASQSIGALELWTVVNPSRKAYVPNMQGSTGAMGLMRFALPPRSSAVQPQQGLDPAQLVQIEAVFASASPIPPGEHELVFSYHFPYETSSYDLTRVFAYATRDFRMLVPQSGPSVQSTDLVPSGVATVGGKQYAVWLHRDVAAGTRSSIHLAGLPTRTLLQKVAAEWPRNGLPSVTVLIVAALAACVPLVHAALSTNRPQPPNKDVESPADLVKKIADLDDQFARGDLAVTDYQTTRATLLHRAANVATDLRPGA